MLLYLLEMQIIIAFALNSLMRRPRVARREEGCYSKQGRNGAELLITNMGFVSWDGMIAAGLDGLRRREGGFCSTRLSFLLSSLTFSISLCLSLSLSLAPNFTMLTRICKEHHELLCLTISAERGFCKPSSHRTSPVRESLESAVIPIHWGCF